MRRWMSAVAAVGVSCGVVLTYLRRPFPCDRFGLDPAERYQSWSDGWNIRADSMHPEARVRTKYGPFLQVEWPDGSRSWNWPHSYPVHKTEKWWDGRQTWHYMRGDGPLGTGGHRTGPFPDERPPH